jgi:hypothetical protein
MSSSTHRAAAFTTGRASRWGRSRALHRAVSGFVGAADAARVSPAASNRARSESSRVLRPSDTARPVESGHARANGHVHAPGAYRRREQSPQPTSKTAGQERRRQRRSSLVPPPALVEECRTVRIALLVLCRARMRAQRGHSDARDSSGRAAPRSPASTPAQTPVATARRPRCPTLRGRAAPHRDKPPPKHYTDYPSEASSAQRKTPA